jgi:hypothetical protein
MNDFGLTMELWTESSMIKKTKKKYMDKRTEG